MVIERLRNQRLGVAGPRDPARLVAWFGAVQAQEYGPAKWGLGLRLPAGATDAAVARAIDRGRVLRTHVLRPTWHFVTPRDIRWMLELTAPNVHRRMSPYDRQLGLDAGVKVRAAAVFERALGDGGCLTRAELGERLEREGIPSRAQRLAHLAMYAELEGVICSGPRRGKHATYALLADRAPNAPRLSRDEALAELVRRYFRSHGPATARDFVWWSGLRTADAKRGLEMLRAKARDVDGLSYWTVGPATRRVARRGTVRLLPIYDEYLVAYRDRVAVPHPTQTIVDFWHALVIRGQVAGSWRTTATAAGLRIDVTPLRGLTAAERRGLERSGARYGRFQGAPVTLTVKSG
jgi:hypothetical protein